LIVSMRTYLPVTLSLLLAAAGGCSARAHPAPGVPAAAASGTAPPSARLPFVTPSLLIPDIVADAAVTGHEPDGSRRAIVAQIRVVEHRDGSLERASSLLPSSQTRLLPIELPSRLGGGFVFIASGDSSAQIWRADSWLAPLEPLASTTQPVYETLVGFDRLYVRHARNGPLYGIDLEKGEYTDSSRLPLPLRIGAALFADPWRAVVVADLRGPLATFDAGATWHPLGIKGAVQRLEPLGDRIVVRTREDSWLLSREGVLSPMGAAAAPAAATSSSTSVARDLAPPDRPLGQRPLRAAIARGMPLDSTHVVVAHSGHLATVDLKTGAITALHRDVYPHSFTECSAIPLEAGIGFVCGEQHGSTVLYRLERPARLTPVMQWPAPRAVYSMGNGAIVARAPCPGSEAVEGVAQYCVRNLAGLTRELRFKGDIGAERIAMLADGRVAILIAPRPGAEGRLVVLKGDKSTAFALDFQTVPRSVVEMARRGLWLNGLQEISPGVLSVWVEAGGPVVGLRIDDKGRVTVGPVQKTSSDTGDIIVSGRFGLVWKAVGRGVETVDGGATWKEVDLPTLGLHAAPEQRVCSAAGCVVGGWLRVGWGPPRNEHDMQPPRKPVVRYAQARTAKQLTLDCEATGRTSPPPATTPAPKEPSERQPVRYRYGHGGMVAVAPAGYGYWQAARWLPFGPLAAPSLGPDEEGLSTSSRDYGEVKPTYRVYVWGPKSADWTRSGHWLIRFDDPYDAVSTPRSTSVAVSPFADINAASAILNSRSDQIWFDAEMRSGVMGWCYGMRQCKYFGIAPQELPVPFANADGSGLPNVISAVRVEDNWFLLAPGQQGIELWSASLSGVARLVRSYPRQEYGDQVSLVRRARSPGLGILTTSPLAGRTSAEWVVLPIDPGSGEIVDAVALGPTDLDGALPPGCASDQDGWQLESFSGVAPTVNLPGQPYVSDARLRLRADPGRICTAGVTGRVRRPEGTAPWPPKAKTAASSSNPVRLSVWEGEQGRKLEFVCRAGAYDTDR
jgi:hypothetical protein